MKVHSTNFLIGIFLIVLGALFLLSTFGHLHVDEEYTMAIIFFSAGIVLLIAYFLFRKKIWALILGAVGLFIGSAIYIDSSRILPDEAIGIVLFIILGLVFFNALRGGKRNWWAIIPGGFSFIIAAHIFLNMKWWITDDYHGVIFFGGSGLIFGIIYLLKDEKYNLDWAKYPCIISFIIASIVLFAIDVGDLFSRLIFPVILIALGALILYKSLKKQEALPVEEKPTDPEQKKKTTKKKEA